jgi:hypothetical protein
LPNLSRNLSIAASAAARRVPIERRSDQADRHARIAEIGDADADQPEFGAIGFLLQKLDAGAEDPVGKLGRARASGCGCAI